MTTINEDPNKIVEIPSDGTPLCPSGNFAQWRKNGPAAPLRYQDGHIGHIALDHNLAQAVLEDLGFSMKPFRLPKAEDIPLTTDMPSYDEAASAGLSTSDLLSLDGEAHSRARRVVLPKLSVKVVRSLMPQVRVIILEQLEKLKGESGIVDLNHDYSEPISFATHSILMGFEGYLVEEYRAIFTSEATSQQQFDFARRLIAKKKQSLGDDVLSTLIGSELTPEEQEALTLVLLVSGRDSISYFITTSILALLKNPSQLKILKNEPEKINSAVEELIRFGTMFLTLFPRTALVDFELDGYKIDAGQSVSVSAVAANRDPSRFENPDVLDINRSAAGHIGFGHGIHSCLGQQFARAVLSEAIPSFLNAFPNAELQAVEQDFPMEFAHPIATYKAGSVEISLNGGNHV